MEESLKEVCRGIRVGKILIQTSKDTGEPMLHYLRYAIFTRGVSEIFMVARVDFGFSEEKIMLFCKHENLDRIG